MLNLINMNLSRFVRTKVFYITLILTVLCFGILTRAETDPRVQAHDSQMVEEQSPSDDASQGIVIDEPISLEFSFERMYAGFMASGYVLMMVGIFAVVYAEEERKSGFLKNMLTSKKGKKNVFAAKIPVVFLCALIMFLGSMIAIRIGSLGRGADMYRVCSVVKLVRFTFFEVLLHTVFGIAMMALYEITRNTIVPIVVTIFASGNLHGMLLEFFEAKLVQAFPALRGFVEKYALSDNLVVAKAGEIGDIGAAFPYMSVAAVTVIGLILYSALGMLIFTKRDTI